jgi:hypothetical protein
MKEIIFRLQMSRLWSKNNYFDIVVTKWADLFPDDLCIALDKLDRLYTTPTDYRSWLNGR